MNSQLLKDSSSRYKVNYSTVLSCLDDQGNAERLNVIYSRYQELVEDPAHRSTITEVLGELEEIGEVEKLGSKRNRRYRKTDLPIQEVRNEPLGRQTEGLPDWMEERLEKYVKAKAEELLRRKVDEILNKKAEEVVQSHAEKAVKKEVNDLEIQSEPYQVTNDKKDDPIENLLLDIIETEGELRSSRIYQKFETHFSGEPPSQRTLRRRLQELVKSGRIKAEGERRGRTYSIVNA